MAKPAAPTIPPAQFFNEKWAHLEGGLNKLLTALERQNSISPKEWWTYHDACYNMCVYSEDTFKMPDKLYPKIADTMSVFVSTQAVKLGEKAKTSTPEGLLNLYLQLYNNFVAAATSVRKICTYMHRFWIPQHKNEVVGGIQVREIVPLAYVLWREKCFVPIKGQLLKAVLEIVYNDRTGQKVDMTLVRTLLHSFDAEALGTDDKGFYEREFEATFLDATQLFYLSESTDFIQANGVHEYMKKAEARIEQEQANCKAYYLPQTESKLKNVLNDTLISKHMEPMQASFAEMLAAEELEAMKRLCFLLSRVSDGLANTAKTYEAYLVRTIGQTVIDPQQKKDPKEALTNAVPFVRQLIDVYKKYLRMTEDCFSNHVLFKAAVDKAFQTLVNRDTGKWTMSRLLTIFIDHILKGKEKDLADDAAIDEVLDSVVGLFGYLVDKDEFEEISRKSLARRLLNAAQSFNEGWERSLITKLKAKHGDAFTRRLQGMFTDSQDETIARQREKFEQFNDGPKVGGVSLQVQVLNECFWPLSGADKVPVLGLPVELANCVQRFEEFYKKDTQNRKLKWIFNHGSVQMNADYGKGKQLLLVISPLQACIMLLYNAAATHKFAEIYANLWPGDSAGKAALRSSNTSSALVDIKLDDQLRHAIQPLIAGGSGGPKEKVCLLAVEEGDMDNLRMENVLKVVDKIPPVKRKRIVFPARSAVASTQQDVKDDNVLIQKAREFETDAAIVRILKTRNVIKWNQLQVEVVQALSARFNPSVSLLKKRLESLIDRKFAERDANDHSLLKYVA